MVTLLMLGQAFFSVVTLLMLGQALFCGYTTDVRPGFVLWLHTDVRPGFVLWLHY